MATISQVASDEHIGSLAEAVLESLRGHPDCELKVKQVRKATKDEKKKLAMAMRAKQLKAFGLTANDRGQVKAENTQRFQQFAGLGKSLLFITYFYKSNVGKRLDLIGCLVFRVDFLRHGYEPFPSFFDSWLD